MLAVLVSGPKVPPCVDRPADWPALGRAVADRPLAALQGHALAGRFRAWRGRSGRRYLCTIHFAPDRLTDIGAALVLAVRRGTDGEHRLIDLMAHGAGDAILPELFAVRTRRLGANEWHIHLLAQTAAERAAAMSDLTGAD